MSAPILTRVRWEYLRFIKSSMSLQNRPFLARELFWHSRSGRRFPAGGAAMATLRDAGWIEAIEFGGAGSGMPFRSSGLTRAWQLTEAGKKAVAACPDTFPGVPVCDEVAA